MGPVKIKSCIVVKNKVTMGEEARRKRSEMLQNIAHLIVEVKRVAAVGNLTWAKKLFKLVEQLFAVLEELNMDVIMESDQEEEDLLEGLWESVLETNLLLYCRGGEVRVPVAEEVKPQVVAEEIDEGVESYHVPREWEVPLIEETDKSTMGVEMPSDESPKKSSREVQMGGARNSQSNKTVLMKLALCSEISTPTTFSRPSSISSQVKKEIAAEEGGVREEEAVVEGHGGGHMEPHRPANHQPFVPKSHSSFLSPFLSSSIQSSGVSEGSGWRCSSPARSRSFNQVKRFEETVQSRSHEKESFNPGGGEVFVEGHGGELLESPRSANHQILLPKFLSSSLSSSSFLSSSIIGSSLRLKSELSIKAEAIDCSQASGQTIDQGMREPIGGGARKAVNFGVYDRGKVEGQVAEPPEMYEHEQGGTKDSHERAGKVKFKFRGGSFSKFGIVIMLDISLQTKESQHRLEFLQTCNIKFRLGVFCVPQHLV